MPTSLACPPAVPTHAPCDVKVADHFGAVVALVHLQQPVQVDAAGRACAEQGVVSTGIGMPGGLWGGCWLALLMNPSRQRVPWWCPLT